MQTLNYQQIRAMHKNIASCVKIKSIKDNKITFFCTDSVRKNFNIDKESFDYLSSKMIKNCTENNILFSDYVCIATYEKKLNKSLGTLLNFLNKNKIGYIFTEENKSVEVSYGTIGDELLGEFMWMIQHLEHGILVKYK